jgi:putative ABC transport system permease protein
MAFLRYILRNATRNKMRTALTILSICVCLALMSILYGYLAMEDQFMPILARGNRAIVTNIQGFGGLLPVSCLDRIGRIEGVKAVIPMAWYMGLYEDKRVMAFDQIGTDADCVFDVWDECTISPQDLEAWRKDRRGCVVDRETATRFGWKIGEHITLKGSNYDYDLDLILRGIYDSPQWFRALFFHFAYLDEGLRQKRSRLAGMVGFVFLKATSGDLIPQICESVDEKFANSEHPTWTQSHQEFFRMFSKFLGNIQAYIRNIGLAVVFALTLVAANAMAMSMRERTTEVALLKAMGFRPGIVLILVLGEAILVTALGGLLGVLAAQGLWSAMHVWYPNILPIGHIAWAVLGYGVVVAMAIGLLSGMVPAVRAARLSVIDGLRRLG